MIASIEVTIDTVDVEATTAFWGAALGFRELYRRPPYVVLVASLGAGTGAGRVEPDGSHLPRLVVQGVDEVSSSKSPVHLDLWAADPAQEVARLETLGARRVQDVDETHLGGSRWTVMEDTQGLVFCVCSIPGGRRE